MVSTVWSMNWWQYPLLILLQQIPAPEPTTVLSFGLSVAILRLTSIPSFCKPFLLGTSYQQKSPKLRPSMHSSIVFRSSAFHLHRRDIPSGSLPITFQIQIQSFLFAVLLTVPPCPAIWKSGGTRAPCPLKSAPLEAYYFEDISEIQLAFLSLHCAIFGKEADLLLNMLYFFFVFVWRTIHAKDEPVSCIEKEVVDERHRHQKKHDKHPSVIDKHVFEATILEPRQPQ